MASAALAERLRALLGKLGPYPHAQLSAEDRPNKKESTRSIKVNCPECGYTVHVTHKWLAVGLPVR